MKKLLQFILFFIGIAPYYAFAQHSEKCPVKFGKVLPADFKTNYNISNNADAVVVADVGSSRFSGNNKGGFTLEFTRQVRIHILNKNAYSVAGFEVSLFSIDNANEELTNIKGTTYNLEKDRVTEVKLDKDAVFKDRLDKNTAIRKFTLPGLQEGCIIEVEYTIKSDFIHYLHAWTFQGEYPVLWSEYNAAIPQFFSYIIYSQGYQPFFIKNATDRFETFSGSNYSDRMGSYERYTFNAEVRDCRWVMKNVPSLKQEAFTSTLQNHIAKIEFQLTEIRRPLPPKTMITTWDELAVELMNNEQFGLSLTQDSFFLADIIPASIKSMKRNDISKAKMLYEYIRDNYTCIDYDALYMSQNFRSLYKTKKGNIADINLMLVGMLKAIDYIAEPVILGLKSRGVTFAEYPILTRFNYVIAELNFEGKKYYLDATRPLMGFEKLDPECFNGYARVIHLSGETDSLFFNPDSLLETKNTSVFIVNDAVGRLKGTVQQMPGYYESAEIRRSTGTKNKDQITDQIKKRFSIETEVENFRIDSLTKLDAPIGIFYNFKMNCGNEDLIYFNPLLGEGYEANPFIAAERSYPVEMPYAIDKTFSLVMDVPVGYEIDDLPKPLVLKLNEQNDGVFEYLITRSGDMISLRCRLRIKRTLYAPDEYNLLREFFNRIVAKQNEQIIFKRNK